MSSPLIQLIVLAAVALFLILRLRDVLGTREGFEKPPVTRQPEARGGRESFEVIEGGPDADITDHFAAETMQAKALGEMKARDQNFVVSDFVGGARGAYEMILMAFERGELAEIKPFLSEDVYDSFAQVVEARKERGLTVDATFIGIRETKLVDAEIVDGTEAEITVRFVGELTSVVRDKAGEIVEGDPKGSKKQKDVWTFARELGSANPNWILVATGE